MMAFFLLMWLLGSTSEGDKKGIAEYFQSPLKVALVNGGSGSGDSSSSLKGGGQDLTKSSGQVKRGDVPAPRNTVNLQALRQEQRVAEAAQLRRSASSWRPSSKTTRSLPSTRHRSSST
jgi:chemotaxis protein MotB